MRPTMKKGAPGKSHGVPAHKLGQAGSAFVCPECGHGSSGVMDSRPTMGGIRRRRCCPKCEARWTTYETAVTGIDRCLQCDHWAAQFKNLAAMFDAMKGDVVPPISRRKATP